jgi:hypothetical protein
VHSGETGHETRRPVVGRKRVCISVRRLNGRLPHVIKMNILVERTCSYVGRVMPFNHAVIFVTNGEEHKVMGNISARSNVC